LGTRVRSGMGNRDTPQTRAAPSLERFGNALPHGPAHHRTRVVHQMPQYVVAAVPEQMLTWDAESAVAALGRAGTPVLAIEASGLSDLERFATLAPQLVIGRVVGVGHDQMLATLGRRPADPPLGNLEMANAQESSV
jgi:hypothetical protein